MRGILPLVLCLVFVGHTAAAVQVVEFCPDPYLHDDADEYIVLSGNGPLDDITISDNHGGFRFPPGTTINGLITVARSAQAFRQRSWRVPGFRMAGLFPGCAGYH